MTEGNAMSDPNFSNEAEHRAESQEEQHGPDNPAEERASEGSHGSANPGVTTIPDEVEEVDHDQSNPAEHRSDDDEHGSANPGPA